MIGFRATFNGADFPNIPDEKYTTLLYDFLKFDIGACFNQATGEWCPSCTEPELVHLDLQTWIDAGAGGSNAQFVSKIVKSNTALGYTDIDVAAPIGGLLAQPGTAVMGGSVTDNFQPGDRYKIILYADSIDGPTGVDSVNGNPAHTWFSGHVVG